jgi:hypothetical protein
MDLVTACYDNGSQQDFDALYDAIGEAERLLREVEWSAGDMGPEGPICPVCQRPPPISDTEYTARAARYEAEFKRPWPFSRDGFGHRPDCRLAAVLK